MTTVQHSRPVLHSVLMQSLILQPTTTTAAFHMHTHTHTHASWQLLLTISVCDLHMNYSTALIQAAAHATAVTATRATAQSRW